MLSIILITVQLLQPPVVTSLQSELTSCLGILAIGSAVRADTSSDLASLQEVNPQDLLNNITSLSGGPSLNASHIPTPEEVGNAFKKKCLQNADEQAFDKAMVSLGAGVVCPVVNVTTSPEYLELFQESQVQVSECVQSLANTTELRQEVEKAKPTGDLDVVFRKYCRYEEMYLHLCGGRVGNHLGKTTFITMDHDSNPDLIAVEPVLRHVIHSTTEPHRKSPVLQSCITNFTAGIEPCLDGKEKESLSLIQNITESLISFVCFKEGDRIARECQTLHTTPSPPAVNPSLGKRKHRLLR
uniref:Uncharacterized protein n=1 Tax=Timema tahoe TaxID=61484 RepID=A0A7R9IKS2_9NEOP|nr:unnamed protein product [Timema tahoe]